MKLSAIYLDGNQPIPNDPADTDLNSRQIFLKRTLEQPVGSSQFLVTTYPKATLEMLRILPFESRVEVINPTHITSGAIASALLPYDRIEDSSAIALLPTNSLVTHDNLTKFVQGMLNSDHEAGVLLVESINPNFSYVRMFESKIIEFVEKRVVGNYATTGVFFFRDKKILLDCARWAFVNNQTTNTQYYVAPSLNHILTSGRSIGYQVLAPSQYQHLLWTTEKGE
jgi:hypothetical protein